MVNLSGPSLYGFLIKDLQRFQNKQINKLQRVSGIHPWVRARKPWESAVWAHHVRTTAMLAQVSDGSVRTKRRFGFALLFWKKCAGSDTGAATYSSHFFSFPSRFGDVFSLIMYRIGNGFFILSKKFSQMVGTKKHKNSRLLDFFWIVYTSPQ